LSAEVGIPATFIQSDLYDLPAVLHEEFDVVYTSWGVLCWLPDLARWGQVIARCLKPCGFFYIAETHPYLNTFYNEAHATHQRVHSSFFPQPAPTHSPVTKDYPDPSQTRAHAS